jgi:hypothetical protein
MDQGDEVMLNYEHALAVLFPEGPAKAKIIDIELGQRRDPESWSTRVDTLIVKLAVIHASGKKDIYEDSIPITRTFAWRLDELRQALGETLPADDDPNRANWNEETALGETVFVLFSVSKNNKKSWNNIRYLLPVDGAEIFAEAVTKIEEASA